MLSVIGIHLIFHDYHDNPRSDHFFMACAAIDLQWGDLGHGPETRIRILRTEYASSPGGYIVPTEGWGKQGHETGKLEIECLDFSRAIDQSQERPDSEVSGG